MRRCLGRIAHSEPTVAMRPISVRGPSASEREHNLDVMARILLNGEFRDEPTAASIAKRFSAMAHSRREFFMAAYRDETFRPGSGWCRSSTREQGQARQHQ